MRGGSSAASAASCSSPTTSPTAAQVAALTAALRGRRRRVIAIDEEGGDVTRLEAGAGARTRATRRSARSTTRADRGVGGGDRRRARAVGVNLNLAPVADVNTNPLNPVIGVRSFGGDPELAARHVAAFVEGLQGAGVAACAKHFPGHGDTRRLAPRAAGVAGATLARRCCPSRRDRGRRAARS